MLLLIRLCKVRDVLAERNLHGGGEDDCDQSLDALLVG